MQPHEEPHPGGYRVIFSDLHFGDPHCALNSEVVALGLKHSLVALGPIEELILAGDILDANIASLTRAIEGHRHGGRRQELGFRRWLAGLLDDTGIAPRRIVYVPGNHDYVVWNLLATDRAFVEPLARGEVLTGEPLLGAFFERPFLAGAAPPAYRDGRFVVSYPDYDFMIDRERFTVTHGHYLDPKQTEFVTLRKLLLNTRQREQAVRAFFVKTAQYQAVANAVSYLNQTRSVTHTLHSTISELGQLFAEGETPPFDHELLDAVEVYLRYFKGEPYPDVFVFGHTHRIGQATASQLVAPHGKRLLNHEFALINCGSFIKTRRTGPVGAFLVIDSERPHGKRQRMFQIDAQGKVAEKVF